MVERTPRTLHRWNPLDPDEDYFVYNLKKGDAVQIMIGEHAGRRGVIDRRSDHDQERRSASSWPARSHHIMGRRYKMRLMEASVMDKPKTRYTFDRDQLRTLIAYTMWKGHQSTDESLSQMLAGAKAFMEAKKAAVNWTVVDALLERCFPPQTEPERPLPGEAEIKY